MISLIKLVSTGFILSLLLFFIKSPVLADIRCETQYGGNQVCVRTGNIQINKTVCDPDKGDCAKSDDNLFVDNLGLTNRHFAPGEKIHFKLRVTNTGDAAFDTVNVTDTLPAQLQLFSGQLTYTINNLQPGATDTKDILATVVTADKFPQGQNVVCQPNTAQAKAGDMTDTDTSQVCLEAKAAPVLSLPQAGSSDLFILLGSLFISAYGFYLLKFKKFI